MADLVVPEVSKIFMGTLTRMEIGSSKKMSSSIS